jgi:hypothetical protein
MRLEGIKHTLDSLGYHTSLYGNEFLRVAKKTSEENPMIVNMEDFFGRVYMKKNQFMFLVFGPQIPDERYFDSESQVIAFIKKQFPL